MMISFLAGVASKCALSPFYSSRAAQATRLVTFRCFSSAEDEIKTGSIKYFSYKNQFGFILPDGVDKHKHDDSDLVFIHRNDIKPREGADGEKFYPGLRKNDRVAFKVGPPEKEGAKCGKAYDLTLENGELVPAFQPGYLERFTKTQKAQFGDQVFAIMSTCTDQQDMETQIVAAFDKVKENIERQRAKMERAGVQFEEK